MRRILFSFALTLAVITPLPGDWKIVTTNDGRTTTAYYKGALLRTDVSPGYISVADFDHRKQITWSDDLRQYAVSDWPALPPSPLPGETSSQPVIKVERVTTDTGERREFFGRAGRHFITRMVRDGMETESDGWYIDIPGLPKWKLGGGAAMAVVTISGGNQQAAAPRIELKQTGPAPEGLPVLLKTMSHVTIPGAPASTFKGSLQVIELTEAPLSERLFQPPKGYKRVDQLMMAAHPEPRGWAEYAQYEWRKMATWVDGVFSAH